MSLSPGTKERNNRMWSGFISRWIAAFVCGLLASACLLPVSATAQTISVAGASLLNNGSPWIPKGFTVVGHVAPPRELSGWPKEASALQGPGLFARARSFGANTLRYQVSQPGLDPRSSIYDPQYLGSVVAAVKQARAAGFVVIVSMQWEPPAGLKGQPDMPGAETQHAWSQLARAFASDGGVMLELFNEPSMWETNPKAWQVWQAGMQALVTEIRNAGAKNVLVLDGIHGSHILAGAPEIHDPLHQLAYAVHPYIEPASRGPADWQRQWGVFAQSHPVFISEWNADSMLQCTPDQPQISHELMDFIGQRHLGLIFWAIDIPETLQDSSGQPMGYKGFKCGVPGAGAAYISVQYFRNH
jgi:endoglucanase